MTKDECKKLLLDLKENMDRNFENELDEILLVGGDELDNAEPNYGFARSVFAALLLKSVRSFDGWSGTNPQRNVTVRISKNGALLDRRY